MAYNTLGIGRLIYQLPIPLCEMFMHEVFGDNIPDSLDEETLVTINKFFENNLNVSETSGSSMYTGIRWFTGLRSCRRAQGWISASLTTR